MGVAEHAHNMSTGEAETGGSELEASLGYIPDYERREGVRPTLQCSAFSDK
jgi:hypothetical protein